MVEENKDGRKGIRLTLNDDFIDKIIGQLSEMKTNHNKVVKIASGDKKNVLVIAHTDNDMNKKED